MAYTPTNWKNGDVVTSAKLNKLEQGVTDAGGVLVCHEDETTGALDHTFKEIADAGFVVLSMVLHKNDVARTNVYTLAYLEDQAGKYTVVFSDDGDNLSYTASAENEYPVYDSDDSDDSPNVQ